MLAQGLTFASCAKEPTPMPQLTAEEKLRAAKFLFLHGLHPPPRLGGGGGAGQKSGFLDAISEIAQRTSGASVRSISDDHLELTPVTQLDSPAASTTLLREAKKGPNQEYKSEHHTVKHRDEATANAHAEAAGASPKQNESEASVSLKAAPASRSMAQKDAAPHTHRVGGNDSPAEGFLKTAAPPAPKQEHETAPEQADGSEAKQLLDATWSPPPRWGSSPTGLVHSCAPAEPSRLPESAGSFQKTCSPLQRDPPAQLPESQSPPSDPAASIDALVRSSAVQTTHAALALSTRLLDALTYTRARFAAAFPRQRKTDPRQRRDAARETSLPAEDETKGLFERLTAAAAVATEEAKGQTRRPRKLHRGMRDTLYGTAPPCPAALRRFPSHRLQALRRFAFSGLHRHTLSTATVKNQEEERQKEEEEEERCTKTSSNHLWQLHRMIHTLRRQTETMTVEMLEWCAATRDPAMAPERLFHDLFLAPNKTGTRRQEASFFVAPDDTRAGKRTCAPDKPIPRNKQAKAHGLKQEGNREEESEALVGWQSRLLPAPPVKQQFQQQQHFLRRLRRQQRRVATAALFNNLEQLRCWTHQRRSHWRRARRHERRPDHSIQTRTTTRTRSSTTLCEPPGVSAARSVLSPCSSVQRTAAAVGSQEERAGTFSVPPAALTTTQATGAVVATKAQIKSIETTPPRASPGYEEQQAVPTSPPPLPGADPRAGMTPSPLRSRSETYFTSTHSSLFVLSEDDLPEPLSPPPTLERVKQSNENTTPREPRPRPQPQPSPLTHLPAPEEEEQPPRKRLASGENKALPRGTQNARSKHPAKPVATALEEEAPTPGPRPPLLPRPSSPQRPPLVSRPVRQDHVVGETVSHTARGEDGKKKRVSFFKRFFMCN